ncbi:hypothetical protein TeGR_g10282, partial [Tetraparma gracilis]
TEGFDDYLSRKRRDGAFGNDPEIQAASELYNRRVLVFTEGSWPEPVNVYSSSSASAAGDEPIRLAYRDGNHFDAIVDPLLPTAGLGLGLPGLQPGLADRSQMQRARELSDAGMTDELVRRKMLMVTDEEETQREIERSIM